MMQLQQANFIMFENYTIRYKIMNNFYMILAPL